MYGTSPEIFVYVLTFKNDAYIYVVVDMRIYYFSIATVTNYHNLWGLQQNQFISQLHS